MQGSCRVAAYRRSGTEGFWPDVHAFDCRNDLLAPTAGNVHTRC